MEKLSWSQVGEAEEDFIRETEDLYWRALELELADALLSLNWMLGLHQPASAVEVGPSALEDRVPLRLGPPMWAWNPIALELEEVIDTCMPKAMEYSQELQDMDSEILLTRYLLVGLGMLDIDEIIEYRDPLLPSQSGPPQFHAERVEDGVVQISMDICNTCQRPIRGLAWTCRAGCRDTEGVTDQTAGPLFTVCMPCHSNGRHPTEHLVRSPHSYPITSSLQRELDAKDFWNIRRQIQRQQDLVDAEQDRAELGLFWSTATLSISSISRGFFPLGNVHSCLMLGPLNFEIGVPDSQGGVRISCRKHLNLGKTWGLHIKQDALALSSDRKLFKTEAPTSRRATQAVIKQILGGAFSGYHEKDRDLESLITNMLYSCASKWKEHPLRPREENHKSLLRSAHKIIDLLKLMIGDRVKAYLQAFARALFAKEVDLRWARFTNNCQNFCDTVLQQPCFSTIFPQKSQLARFPTTKEPKLDYLLSFRTEKDLGDALLASKASCGPLATFFKQLHNQDNVLNAQADMVEQDAGGNPLNCAKLLAWPCQSEDCGLTDHIWTNPAEFSSILQMHLLVDRGHYLQEIQPESEPEPLTDIQWAQNRIAVLQGIDTLLTSGGAVSRVFQERWLADDSRAWDPPPPYCIPQNYPFTCDGDYIRMTYQDPAPSQSLFSRWFGNTGGERPAIQLPGLASNRNVVVVEPNLRGPE